MADSRYYPTLAKPDYETDPQYLELANTVMRRLAQRPVAPPPEVVAPPPQQQALFPSLYHGLQKGGSVYAPELLGKALKAFGADETGASLIAGAEERGRAPEYQNLNPWGEAVAGAVPVLGSIAAAPALAAAAGAVGAPAAVAGAVGTVGSLAFPAALFGGEQYTTTREKGGSVAQALGTGAIQGAGQLYAAHKIGRLVGGAIEKTSAQGVLNTFSLENAPSLLGTAVKNTVSLQATQVPTQMAAAAGVAGIEQGLPNTPTPWEAAKSSVMPTLMMNTVLAPLGIIGGAFNARNRQRTGAMLVTPPSSELPPVDLEAARRDRLKAMTLVYNQMHAVDPARANAWMSEANDAIWADKPVALDANFKFDIFADQPQQPPPAPMPTLEPEQPQDASQFVGAQPRPTPLQEQINQQTGVSRAASPQYANPYDAYLAWRHGDEERQALDPSKIGVTEGGPVEHIGIGTAPETIDIAAPHEPPAYPVEEHPTIDVGTPEGYAAANKQSRAVWLKSILGGNAYKAAGKLSELHPDELAAAVQKMWTERVGSGDAAGFLPKLEEVYTRLTGRDIRQPLFDDPQAEARRVEDSTRRIVTDVEGLQGDGKYEALRDNARRARVIEEVQKAMREESINESREGSPGAEPKPAPSAPRPEVAEAVDQLAAAAGNATAVAGKAAEAKVVEAAPTNKPAPTPAPNAPPEPAPVRAPAPPPAPIPGDPAPIAAARKLVAATSVPTFATRSIRGVAKKLGIEIKEGDLPAEVMAKIQQAIDQHDISTTGDVRPVPGRVGYGEVSQDALPQGDMYAAGTRKVEQGGGEERQGISNIGQGEGVDRGQPSDQRSAGAEDGTGDSTAKGGQKQQGDAAARQREEELAQVKGQQRREKLALSLKAEEQKRIEDALLDARRALSKINIRIVGKPTEEQKAQKSALLDQVESLIQMREALVKSYSDLVGREERITSGGEPTEKLSYYGFNHWMWDERRGLSGNLALLHPFMEALHYAGRGDEVKGLIKMQGFRPTQKTVVTAREALNSLGADEMLRYKERVEQYRNTLDTFERWRIARNKVDRAFRDQVLAELPYTQRINEINQMYRAGEITVEEAAQHRLAAANQREITQDNLDNKKRGLIGLNDEKLDTAVRAAPNAMGALAHIAKTHADPMVRTVAKIIADRKPTTQVVVVDNPDFNGGYYSTARDTVYLGRGGVNAVTVMHEILHAEAHVAIRDALMNELRASEELSPVERKEVAALQEIRRIQEKFRGMADLDNPAHRLALDNPHEFVSEALANPEIQQMLSKGNWLTRLYNAIANALGLRQHLTGDFAKLMSAATDMFGEARDHGDEIFGSFISRDAVTGRPEEGPWGAQQMTRIAHNQLASVSPKLATFLRDKIMNPKVQKEATGWITLNDITELLSEKFKGMIAKYPGAAQHLNPMLQTYNGFRQGMDLRRGMQNFLSSEAQELQLAKLAFQKRYPALFDRMVTMATEASRGGIDPAAETYEQAKRRDPALTEEAYNRPEARAWRRDYQQLKQESARIEARDGRGALTPLKLYHSDLDRNSAMNARLLLSIAKQTMQAHDMPMTADLDWQNHRHESPRHEKLPLAEQRDRIMTAVDSLRARLTTAAKPYETLSKAIDVEKAKLEQAGLSAADKKTIRESIKTMQDGLQHLGPASDALSAKQAIDDAYGLYSGWQKVPYFHIGRTGDWFIKGTVADIPGAWERVGAIVGADRTAGGLHRQWGPPVNNNRDMFMRFEDASAHNDAIAKLEALRREGVFSDTWASGYAPETHRFTDAASPQYVRVLTRRINASNLSETAKQDMIREVNDTWIQQLPESSSLKSSLFRDGDVGYSKDFINTAANRATMANNALARASTAPLIGKALADLDTQMRGLNRETAPPGFSAAELENFKGSTQAYINELKERVDLLNTPASSPNFDRVRAITATWDLAISPAYFMTTMYQPMQITLPWIGGRYGYVDTSKAMARNAGVAFAIIQKSLAMGWASDKSGLGTKIANLSDLKVEFAKLKKADGSPLLTDQQVDVLDHLMWTGLLNYGQTNMLARLDPSDQSAGAKALRMASMAPHYIEVVNRMVSMLTGYEMARTKGGLSHEEAKNYALQTVRDTDGDHSQANVARQLGRRGIFKTATPLMVGFGQYNLQMLGLMLRTLAKSWGTGKEAGVARKQLAGMLVTTGMAGGTLSLPFMTAAAGIANYVLSAFGDPNDDPPDVEHAWQQSAKLLFGEKGGEIVSRGLPRAFDFDMSGRIGFQDIVPFSKFLSDRRKLEDKWGDGALAVMGPTVGMVQNAFVGYEGLKQGDIVKFIDKALPAAIRNVAKAHRIANYGYETEGGNNQIPIGMPSNWNVFMQAMGFTPAAKADYSETAFAFNTSQRILQQRHQALTKAIYLAVEHNDYDALGQAFQANIDFMIKHPTMQSDPVAGLKQRAMARYIGQASGTGILTGRRQFPLLQDYQ